MKTIFFKLEDFIASKKFKNGSFKLTSVNGSLKEDAGILAVAR